MANGTMEDKLHEVWQAVDDVRLHGCAKRDADLIRIANVETSLSEMRSDIKNILRATIGSTITLLILTCAFLLKYVLFR